MKERKFIFFGFLLLLASSLVLSQEAKPADIDGYKWAEMSAGLKIGYIMGFSDAAFLVEREYQAKLKEYKLINEEWLSWLQGYMLRKYTCPFVAFGQVKDGLDDIYKNYSNKHIPFSYLLPLICMRIRGEISDEEIEKELQRLRAEVINKRAKK